MLQVLFFSLFRGSIEKESMVFMHQILRYMCVCVCVLLCVCVLMRRRAIAAKRTMTRTRRRRWAYRALDERLWLIRQTEKERLVVLLRRIQSLGACMFRFVHVYTCYVDGVSVCVKCVSSPPGKR